MMIINEYAYVRVSTAGQRERRKITFAEALEQTGLKQATFYNRLREFRGGKKRTTKRCTFL